MSQPLISVPLETELRDARAIMEARRIHHLMVEDRGRIVAIVSDRDLYRGVSPRADSLAARRQDEETLRRRVFQVASYRLVTTRRTATVAEAAALILERNISALPVTNEAGEIMGIVTVHDLLHGLLTCVLPVQNAAA